MSHYDEDDQTLRLFKSPLIHSVSVAGSSHGHSPEPFELKEEHKEATPERESDALDRTGTHLAIADDHALHERPEFHRHTEATNAELFYDLFFVANLTVFTSVHEVNDDQTLSQYIGYFCILWFTWYQVGLYDVRFSMDSVFERVAKACQFGVMIGFAITGPKFDVGKLSGEQQGEGPSYRAFQHFSLIIMASRLVLVFQYLQSLYFMRHFKRTRLPMALVAGTYFIAAMIYLGLYWSFHPTKDGSQNNAFVAWYVVAILETILVTAVSCVWRQISFKGTHLIQRMSLLTLIILGEGVIGLAERCSSIVEAEVFDISSAPTLGNIICAILILYFLYMLYFDWIEEKHFGTIRQQVWAFLHFPLHLFLVLAVEAVGQCLIWNAATVAYNALDNNLFAENGLGPVFLNNGSITTDPATWNEVANSINETAQVIIDAGVISSKSFEQTVYVLTSVREEVNAAVKLLSAGQTVSSSNLSEDIINSLVLLLGTLATVLYDIAGFAPPSSDDSSSSSSSSDVNDLTNSAYDEFNKITNVFQLTFVYFFVSVGLVIILDSVIAAISKRSKSKLHWLRLATSCTLGVCLCLIALIALSNSATSSSEAFSKYTGSPWILPTVCLALFVSVLINTVKFPRWVFATLRNPDLEKDSEPTPTHPSAVELHPAK